MIYSLFFFIPFLSFTFGRGLDFAIAFVLAFAFACIKSLFLLSTLALGLDFFEFNFACGLAFALSLGFDLEFGSGLSWGLEFGLD